MAREADRDDDEPDEDGEDPADERAAAPAARPARTRGRASAAAGASPRARNLALLSILVAVGGLAAVALFSNRDDRSRNDALLFLDRYGELDVDDPVDDRRERVEALAAIPFSAGDVDRVRDTCVEAHRTLILAEDRGTEARAAFDRATAGGRVAESEIPTETRASIEAALAESNDALARAREQLPRCMSEARRLEVRYQQRRRSQR